MKLNERNRSSIGSREQHGKALVARSATYFAQKDEVSTDVDPLIAIAQLEAAINRLRRRRFDVDGNGIVIDFHDRQREQLTGLYRHMIENRIGGVALSSLSSAARFALKVAERI